MKKLSLIFITLFLTANIYAEKAAAPVEEAAEVMEEKAEEMVAETEETVEEATEEMEKTTEQLAAIKSVSPIIAGVQHNPRNTYQNKKSFKVLN